MEGKVKKARVKNNTYPFEVIKKISSELPRGAKKEIAENLGIEYSTLSQMFIGYITMKHEVMSEAVRIVGETRRFREENMNRINKLLSV